MTSKTPPRYRVRPSEVPAYSPANHSGTVNRRLISPQTVGASQLEVLHGTLAPGEGAMPHSHPDLEQVCYVLSGRARAQIGAQTLDLAAGDACFFPMGVAHSLVVTSDEPLELLVIYSPPYLENPGKVVRTISGPSMPADTGGTQ
jgi:mannose-6-phosphate isomerase-like protein (cupin superfamily)